MSTLTHLPRTNLTRHGVNDFKEPKYRCIWALSRIITISNGEKHKTFPMYAADHLMWPIGPFWILEGWQSCLAITGGLTEAQWLADPRYVGREYPSRGDYVHCYTFDVQPTSGVVARVISWIEEGRKRRPIENQLAIRAEMEGEDKEKDRIIRDRISNRMIPWAGLDVVGGRFRKNSKTAKQVLTAEQAGLSTSGLATRQMKTKYRVPIGRDGIIKRRKSGSLIT